VSGRTDSTSPFNEYTLENDDVGDRDAGKNLADEGCRYRLNKVLEWVDYGLTSADSVNYRCDARVGIKDLIGGADLGE